MRAEKMKTIITILLLLASTSVMAQQQTIYDPNGKVTERINYRQQRIEYYLRRQRARHRPHINRQPRHHDDL